ncbi:hypothetical protein CYMTET_15991 [Cymbomonas tetramitiformis]|uniref:SET domain-containing protein n=1 Tax=Cymbomonas tetramitiformis TaxID=36881 RepID=A0AAE0GDG0_9CHLO|nr:hypothetical protein CYMTET_15991 [Cymbomonas tetramitiformis]
MSSSRQLRKVELREQARSDLDCSRILCSCVCPFEAGSFDVRENRKDELKMSALTLNQLPSMYVVNGHSTPMLSAARYRSSKTRNPAAVVRGPRGGNFVQRPASSHRASEVSPLARQLPVRRSRPRLASAEANIETETDEARFEEFFEFLRANGADTTGVKVVPDDNGGHGLVAARKANEGDVLVILPPHLQLSYRGEGALARLVAQVPPKAWLPGEQGKQATCLAMALLAHRAQDNVLALAPYLRTLPASFPGSPVFFAAAEFDALQMPLASVAKQRCAALHHLASGPLAGPQPAFSGCSVDLNAVGWALACVSSRAFRVHGAGLAPSLLPVMDLANHALEPNVRVSAEPDGTVTMRATAPLETGEAVLNNYGALSNDFLLLDYGFVIDDNPFDRVELRFDLAFVAEAAARAGGPSVDLPLPAWKAEALAGLLALQGNGGTLEVLLGGEELASPSLLAATRIVHASTIKQARSLLIHLIIPVLSRSVAVGWSGQVKERASRVEQAGQGASKDQAF